MRKKGLPKVRLMAIGSLFLINKESLSRQKRTFQVYRVLKEIQGKQMLMQNILRVRQTTVQSNSLIEPIMET